MNRKHVLVTGGTGFIGGHLIERLLADGYRVTAMVRRSSKYQWLSTLPAVEIVFQDDVLDGNFSFQGVDIVYHLAAIRHRYGTSDAEYRTANVELTRHLLDRSQRHIGQFIFCSSIAVFGWPPRLPISDENPYAPVSSYARSKVDCEKLVFDYHRRGKVPTTIVRPSITYGPRDETGMMTKLITLIHKGTYRTVGNGKNRVQLAYITDVLDGFVRVIGHEGAFGQGFIITAARPATINELVQIICQHLNKPEPKPHIPLWFARLAAWNLETLHQWGLKLTGKQEPVITNEKIDVMTTDRAYDISKARQILNYQPQIDYPEGIQKTITALNLQIRR
ncbi:MAG: NAD(P)-dependent oxidoreductase [Gemmatimonadetes bacterium]|nr:MAG: NAD(P)-dependent oxidoreductase [Gemmatimonadota bacterium]